MIIKNIKKLFNSVNDLRQSTILILAQVLSRYVEILLIAIVILLEWCGLIATKADQGNCASDVNNMTETGNNMNKAASRRAVFRDRNRWNWSLIYIALSIPVLVAQDVDLNALPVSKGFRILGAAEYDTSGNSVSAAGDINGDGVGDIIIGADQADPSVGTEAGISYVIFGRDIDAGGTAFSDIQLTTGTDELPSDVGFRILGPSANQKSGCAVSRAGDVNHDGVDDVIVGALYADPASGDNAGIAYVIFGRSLEEQISNPFTDIQLTAGGTLFSAANGFRILGAAADDYLGYAVSAAGDINGDDLDDILISAYQADPPGKTDAGIVYVIYGRDVPGGDIQFGELPMTPTAMPTTIGFRIFGAADNDRLGSAVSAAGDVNGDGIGDIIIGAYQADTGNGNEVGISYVIFGTDVQGGANPYGDIQLPTAAMPNSLGFRIKGASANDFSGYSVGGGGDVNGDGIDDVIVGAFQADPPSRPNGGIAYVIFGRDISGGDPVFGDVQLTTGVNPMLSIDGFRILGAATSYSCGRSVSAAGDVNGDGISDIIVGSSQANALSRGLAGVSYVIFGRDISKGAPLFGDIQLTNGVTELASNIGFRILGAADGDESGYSVSAAGDINGDGIGDVIVGAFIADPPGALNAGISYVIFGTAMKPSSQPSSQPSRQPSRQPSSQPSRQPSRQPTGQPSVQPRSNPTSQPSGQPTQQPSRQPSVQPSTQPILRPSSQPSGQPSRQPTGQPSAQPRGAPTSQPSRQPTQQPSRQPSVQPSMQPLLRPSSQPSGQPSRQPTGQPSVQPRGDPTSQPSGQPTKQPTRQPSSQPSTQPFLRPSSCPTSQPSFQPTINPTTQPSTQPTLQPVRWPSAQPTSQPISQPSAKPTTQPQSRPSSQPSAQPSNQPSAQPSLQPLLRPSAHPSGQPTRRPSAQPSSQPSNVPSAQPSQQPSVKPSAIPSSQPSNRPSTQPSTQPWSQPSGQPSAQPINLPSAQPSTQPSSSPSSQPSKQPSAVPSRQPSSQPSSRPSAQPTGRPSGLPTAQPSLQPFVLPSARPSAQPSIRPSSQPTVQPSMLPSCQPISYPSGMPSSQPSQQPSSQPTTQPTVLPSFISSLQPTSQPSSRPSIQPSSQPSQIPSLQPSIQPSSAPSTQSTEQPTSTPSVQPSSQPSTLPSQQPSNVPSTQPSAQPTVVPSGLPTSQPSQQPIVRPSSQPTSSPSKVEGEWVTTLGNISFEISRLSLVYQIVWGVEAAIEKETATKASCILVDPIQGTKLFRHPFQWTNIVFVAQVDDASSVIVSGNDVGFSAGTVYMATCKAENGQLTCTAVSFAGTLIYGSYASLVKQYVYVGQFNDKATITIVSGDPDVRLRHFWYTSRYMENLSLLFVKSLPNFIGNFVAGMCKNSGPVHYIFLGIVRADSGTMSAMYLTPVIGSILNSAELVKVLVLEPTGPDSFIAGGLELSDGAGMHAYLLRVNALFREVLYGVRYLPQDVVSGHRRLLGDTTANSFVAAIVRVESSLYLLVNIVLPTSSARRSSVSVLRTDISTGGISQQVRLSSNDASIQCTDMISSDLFLILSCTVKRADAETQAVMLSVNRKLTFSKLPLGFVKNEEIYFVAESVPFMCTTLPVRVESFEMVTTNDTFTVVDEFQVVLPSQYPSMEPSTQLSSAPSGQPSSSPTSAPSISPQPTSQPSSSGPTNTYKPTVKPTQRPSRVPSKGPTRVPSVSLTLSPSTQVSSKPSASSSSLPSAKPITGPSRSPTEKPSRLPSLHPTSKQTNAPSVVSGALIEGKTSQSNNNAAFAIFGYVVAGLCGLWFLWLLRRWCTYKLLDVQSDANRKLYVESMGYKPLPRFPIVTFFVSLCCTIHPVEIDFVLVESETDNQTSVTNENATPARAVYDGVGANLEGHATFRDLEANVVSKSDASDVDEGSLEEPLSSNSISGAEWCDHNSEYDRYSEIHSAESSSVLGSTRSDREGSVYSHGEEEEGKDSEQRSEMEASFESNNSGNGGIEFARDTHNSTPSADSNAFDDVVDNELPLDGSSRSIENESAESSDAEKERVQQYVDGNFTSDTGGDIALLGDDTQCDDYSQGLPSVQTFPATEDLEGAYTHDTGDNSELCFEVKNDIDNSSYHSNGSDFEESAPVDRDDNDKNDDYYCISPNIGYDSASQGSGNSAIDSGPYYRNNLLDNDGNVYMGNSFDEYYHNDSRNSFGSIGDNDASDDYENSQDGTYKYEAHTDMYQGDEYYNCYYN